jgi:hydroxymethylglutaryl-CoA reductase
MAQKKAISGFSKLTPRQKTEWLRDEHGLPADRLETLTAHLHSDPQLQALYNEFSENTVSNFFVPYGLAPNFLINGRWYVVPMAIEESSVVAAASHAAKFWSDHGGFHAEVVDQVKVGQVHFYWTGSEGFLSEVFESNREKMIRSMDPFTESMRKRSGGIKDILLTRPPESPKHYYQLQLQFLTANAMGANFINTVLEELSKVWRELVSEQASESKQPGELEVNMAILSNYTPESLVKVWVETELSSLGRFDPNLPGEQFAEKFVRATEIARIDTYRAVTHNKGIFNGMDAVVIATGNDFRAVEACGHAYAARDGRYRSLSRAEIKNNIFRFELEVAMSVGTVGGLTSGHPLAATSLKILHDPSAGELMMIIAAAGLANNFSAVRSLTTSGIQQGHMKMHLTNILRQLGADEQLKMEAVEFFRNRTVRYADVKKFVQDKKNQP